MGEIEDQVPGSAADDSEKTTTSTVMERSGTAPGAHDEPDLEASVTKEEPTGEVASAAAATWDGPDDPENPMNWPDSKKWTNISILSILTLVTYAFDIPRHRSRYA